MQAEVQCATQGRIAKRMVAFEAAREANAPMRAVLRNPGEGARI